MLEITNFTYKIKDKVLFDDTNLLINDDDVVFLLGSNGCGKSTLLNIISNTIKHNKIEIKSDFKDVFYLSDKFTLINHLNSLDNLIYFNNYFKSRENPYELMQALMIENRAVNKLSKGNRQKLALAISLISNANLVLIDEALDGLDAESVRIFIKKLKTINKAALVVTHDNRVYKYKNVRRIKIDNGKLIES